MVVAWIWISTVAEIIKLSALLYFGTEIQCTSDLVCKLIRVYRNEDKDMCWIHWILQEATAPEKTQIHNLRYIEEKKQT